MSYHIKMHKHSGALLLAIVLLVSSASVARAGVDEKVLGDFFAVMGDGAKAARVSADAAQQPADVSGTIANLNVVRRWGELKPETKDALSPYMRVVGEADGSQRVLYQGTTYCATVLTTNVQTRISQHFNIFYTTDSTLRDAVSSTGSGNTPDYIQNILTYLEDSWNHEVGTLGFTQPPLNSTGRYDVYICDLTGRNPGLLGLTLTEATLSDFSARSHLELDNDYAGVHFLNGVTLTGMLQVTIAHELFHAIQFGGNYRYPSDWVLEALATWMEDEVFPTVNDYVGQYLGSWFSNPSPSLDIFSGTDAYGSSIFFRYVSEKVGGSSMAFDLWQLIKLKGTDCDPNCSSGLINVTEIPQISQYLTAKGTTFNTVFKNFAVANYEKDYVDGSLSFFPAVSPSTQSTNYPNTINTRTLDHLSNGYLRFPPANTSATRLTLNLTGSAAASWGMKLVLERVDGGHEIQDVGVAGTTGTAAVDGFGTTYTSIVAVLSNLGTSTSADTASFVLTATTGAACTSSFTTRSFAAGWNLAVFPIVPQSANPMTELGITAAQIYSYNPVTNILSTGSDGGFRALGTQAAGYWLFRGGAGTMSINGCAVSGTTATVDLKAGWNIIGNPFTTAVLWSDAHARVTLAGGASSYTLSEAEANGWINTRLYDYQSGSYARVSANAGQNLAPWTGYWVYVGRNLTLSISQ